MAAYHTVIKTSRFAILLHTDSIDGQHLFLSAVVVPVEQVNIVLDDRNYPVLIVSSALFVYSFY